MKKILIIEDEPNIAKAEGMILGGEHSIHYASDGEDGLSQAKELKPDLVILDLMLPKRQGYDVCFNIRQDKSLQHTKIVMVTAKSLPIDQTKGMFVGADHYLIKPFEADDLRQAVANLLK
ncbi:MAG: response regulator [Nanoarchaeota archaeon]